MCVCVCVAQRGLSMLHTRTPVRSLVRSFARSVLAYELSTHGTERGENGIYVEFSQDVPFIPFFLALALILALTRRLIFPESISRSLSLSAYGSRQTPFTLTPDIANRVVYGNVLFLLLSSVQ